MISRAELRKNMRSQRRAVDTPTRHYSSEALAKRFVSSRLFRCSHHIAFYFPHDGELDPTPLMRCAWTRRKLCYLPVLNRHRFHRLRFALYRKGDPLVYNRFGIPEPRARFRQQLSPRRLDLVLAPLVAFDLSGNRLGMGGGFYDRSFAFLKLRRNWRIPRLMGVAYDFQKVAEIEAEVWDVPLDGVMTEVQTYFFEGAFAPVNS